MQTVITGKQIRSRYVTYSRVSDAHMIMANGYIITPPPIFEYPPRRYYRV
jgi:hypothetical protein